MKEPAPTSSRLARGSITRALIESTDWSRTSLGAFEAWPAALTAHVRAMLHTRQPMCIFWGRELVNLYNDGFLPILGEKHPMAMGQRAEDCWREAWSIVGPQLAQVMSGDNIFHEEVVVPIARGGHVEDAWWNYSYSPLFDGTEIAGVLVVCTEVTREVLARRQLEEANRAKDEFLATVSHELRTPLTAVLGWSRMLADTTDPVRIKKGLAVIERNALAQAKIIDDILDVSRIISGKLRLAVRPLDVRAIVEATVDSIRPGAIAKELTVRVAVDVSSPLVADEDRLQQIVWNLVSNAVKFTPAGGEVSVHAAERGDEVIIRVRDTGKGISAAFLPHAFDRFRQDDASTTKQHQGLGLGLAIVRHLVELHGGTVSAESDGEGRGSTFEVRLPLRGRAARDHDEVPSPPSNEAPPAGWAPRGQLTGVRILVVDDQRDARELVTTVLEDAGAEVIQAESAAEAVRILSTTEVGAIVSDIGMPGEDGYALLARVRSAAHTRDVPALAVTAYARAEDRARALASGFQNHIAKPIEPTRLVAGVVALLQR